MKSQSMSRRAQRRSGFTLVEILVVLGIVAILMNMLISVTATVRERAHRTVCVSNLKQLIMACKMYESDNDQLPMHYVVAFYGQQGHWQEKVLPYVRNRSVFVCPSDPTGGHFTPSNYGGWPTSYSYLLSAAWLDSDNSYRPPAPRSYLFMDDWHIKKDAHDFVIPQSSAMIVGRYDGSVETVGYSQLGVIQYEPADGGGLRIHPAP